MSTFSADTEQRVTAVEVAGLLKCSTAKVHRMARAGEIPSERVGRAYRFRMSAVTAALTAEKPAWSQSRRSLARRRLT